MTTYKMMDEIVCYCTKCKLELNHRIARVEKDLPKRVLCLTCNKEHVYRKAAPAAAGEKKVRKPRVARASASKGEQEAEWRTKLERKNKVAKPYAMDKAFLIDDHIDHKLFGIGLVVSLVDASKINVFFQDGLKLMKCAAPEQKA